jgi:hypothetical protein
MAYKYAIEKKVKELGQENKYAETYLNFNNIAIIPHHGKITAILLIQLCKYIGLDYFVINDWDIETYSDLTNFLDENGLKTDDIYKNASNKGIITTNWKLINNAGKDKIHFNCPKLEGVLGYNRKDPTDSNNLEYKDKGDSLVLWEKLNEITDFEKEFFPRSLESFLEFDKLQLSSDKIFVLSKEDIDLNDIPF